jgi:23S rRNA (pseudouridine1915-N3)-methyltransferase
MGHYWNKFYFLRKKHFYLLFPIFCCNFAPDLDARCAMKLNLLVVGKTTSRELDTLIADYVGRLTHYCSFQLLVIPELKNTKSLTEAQQKQREGELILQSVPATADMILLDEHGTEYRSLELAQWLQKRLSAGRDLWLVIGGPYGFSEAVYQRACGKLSISRLTFSHQMIRLLVVEQLYRAFTILRGENYHHE